MTPTIVTEDTVSDHTCYRCGKSSDLIRFPSGFVSTGDGDPEPVFHMVHVCGRCVKDVGLAAVLSLNTEFDTPIYDVVSDYPRPREVTITCLVTGRHYIVSADLLGDLVFGINAEPAP